MRMGVAFARFAAVADAAASVLRREAQAQTRR